MILIVGATGELGSKITKGIAAAGGQVRILGRPQSDTRALEALGAEVARGDLKDRVSLDRACRGVDFVVTTANSARRGGEDTVATVDRDGSRALVDAAVAAGVRRFVYVSVVGAAPDSPVPFLAAKARTEAYLRASGLTWTILAPNAFMESWPLRIVGLPALAGQPIAVVGEGRRKHTFVAEDDVAAFALTAIKDRQSENMHVPIGGPEALSWRDVVAIYQRILGRPLEMVSVAPGQPIPGIPAPVLPLLAGFDAYDSAFDSQASARTFGIALTPLETVARRQVLDASSPS